MTALTEDQVNAIAENRVLVVLAVNVFLKTYDAEQRKALVDEVLNSEELTTIALEDLVTLLGAMGVDLEAQPAAEEPVRIGAYL